MPLSPNMTINHPDWVTLSRGGRLLARGGGEETWAEPLSKCFHKGEEAVICAECVWRKCGGGGGDTSLHLAAAERPRFAKANGVSAPEKDK